MGPGMLLSRFLWVIGLFWLLSGNALSASRAEAGKEILVARGDSSVRVDKAVLDRQVSRLLGVPEGTLSYHHLPASFPVPDSRDVRGTLQVEGRDGSDTHLALLVKKENVVQEMFYFTVRIGHRFRSSGRPFSKRKNGMKSLEEEEGVRSGDTVRIQAVGTGFVISLPGIAQESGRNGDQIAVFNPMSGSRVQATVTGPDRVRIRLKGADHAAE